MRWVNLTTVDDIFQAQALAHALEEEDIPCIEANENTAVLLPHLRQGIEIRVKDTDYLKAKAISDKVEALRLLRCPRCHSDKLKYQASEEQPLKKIDVIKKLLHFPLGNHWLIYRCLNCNLDFKTK
ncbi:MAG TPA: DUF2007 domain-containing protein [Cyclobacteriaceae bacterium]|nr:DUF2007 domain-containing protein [Cyclobacteriaceae bacterium]